MTFVIALTGKKSIWLCADRRISFPKSYRDDGCKIVSINATDAQGLLGYSGLGLSKNGIEPSAWINDLIRNQPVMPLESYYETIAKSMDKLHPHLDGFGGSKEHLMLVPSIVSGEPRLYGFGTGIGNDTMRRYRFERFEMPNAARRPPRIAVSGTGAHYLARKGKWWRPFLRLIAAFEKGRISALSVADQLAKLNNDVSIHDQSVSAKSIVMWRCNGGGDQFYSGNDRTDADISIPTVSNGMDVNDIVAAIMPSIRLEIAALARGEGLLRGDHAEIQKRLDALAQRKAREL